jgi:hypothetical protein
LRKEHIGKPIFLQICFALKQENPLKSMAYIIFGRKISFVLKHYAQNGKYRA